GGRGAARYSDAGPGRLRRARPGSAPAGAHAGRSLRDRLRQLRRTRLRSERRGLPHQALRGGPVRRGDAARTDARGARRPQRRRTRTRDPRPRPPARPSPGARRAANGADCRVGHRVDQSRGRLRAHPRRWTELSGDADTQGARGPTRSRAVHPPASVRARSGRAHPRDRRPWSAPVSRAIERRYGRHRQPQPRSGFEALDALTACRYFRSIVTLFITTGVVGRSFLCAGTFPIFSTTSMPLTTAPNTECRRSRWGGGATVTRIGCPWWWAR